MQTIGLVGGMSWESTALYYSLLNELVRERLGGYHSARCLVSSVDFAPVEEMQRAGDWDAAGALLASAARSLHAGGADFLVLCTNTMHRVAEEVQAAVPLPLLHIADATAEAVRRAGCRRPALLATRFTMEAEFYKSRLRDRHGIEAIVPDAPGRAMVHGVIYEELCRGEVLPDSKAAYLAIIEKMKEEEGADGVILGCTEIPLIVDDRNSALPTLDSTRALARAALRRAIDG